MKTKLITPKSTNHRDILKDEIKFQDNSDEQINMTFSIRKLKAKIKKLPN